MTGYCQLPVLCPFFLSVELGTFLKAQDVSARRTLPSQGKYCICVITPCGVPPSSSFECCSQELRLRMTNLLGSHREEQSG